MTKLQLMIVLMQSTMLMGSIAFTIGITKVIFVEKEEPTTAQAFTCAIAWGIFYGMTHS